MPGPLINGMKSENVQSAELTAAQRLPGDAARAPVLGVAERCLSESAIPREWQQALKSEAVERSSEQLMLYANGPFRMSLQAVRYPERHFSGRMDPGGIQGDRNDNDCTGRTSRNIEATLAGS